MTTDPHGRRSVILECGCGKYFSHPYPMRGERTYCGLKPGHGWTTIKFGPPVYRAKCRDCSYSRRVGTSVGLAYEKISAHLRSRPAHTMVLYDGLVITDTIAGIGANQSELFPVQIPSRGVDDPPPF